MRYCLANMSSQAKPLVPKSEWCIDTLILTAGTEHLSVQPGILPETLTGWK